MGILKYIFAFIPAIVFTSCLEPYYPNVETKPVLCINSLIKSGESINVQVTHTWYYPDGENIKDRSVDDAVITIYANNVQVDKDYLPKEGDEIRIFVSSEKYGDAEAEVTVPKLTHIKDLSWNVGLISSYKPEEGLMMEGNFMFNLLINATIEDENELPDFYSIDFKSFSPYEPLNPDDHKDSDYWEDKTLYYYPGYLKYDADPIFFENIGDMESVLEAYPQGFNFFTDRKFSGSSYTLHLMFENGHYQVISPEWEEELLNVGLVMTLNSVSKSYYDWENYYAQVEGGLLGDIMDWGFSNPIWAYSNVSTGAGVVCAQTSISYVINLKDYFEKLLK